MSTIKETEKADKLYPVLSCANFKKYVRRHEGITGEGRRLQISLYRKM